MDRRLMGTLAAVVCLGAASLGWNRGNGDAVIGTSDTQSNGASSQDTAKGDAGGWVDLASHNGNTDPGPLGSKEAGGPSVSNGGGTAAANDK